MANYGLSKSEEYKLEAMIATLKAVNGQGFVITNEEEMRQALAVLLKMSRNAVPHSPVRG